MQLMTVRVIYILILRENVIVHPNRFKTFAVENISELFGYIATGRVNIRIHRDITGPPKRSSGKQDVVWVG